MTVETQLFRFVPDDPIPLDLALELLEARRLGDYALHALETPRCTIVIDPMGRIIVHGLHRPEAARAVATEVLVLLGRPQEQPRMEPGPIVASFDYEQPVQLERLADRLGAMAEHDERLGCLRLDDDRHELEVLLWENGRAIVPRARHPNLVAMAAVHWRGLIEEHGAFVEVLVG